MYVTLGFEIGVNAFPKKACSDISDSDFHAELSNSIIQILCNNLFGEIHETERIIWRFISFSKLEQKMNTPLNIIPRADQNDDPSAPTTKEELAEEVLIQEVFRCLDLCSNIASWLLGQEERKASEMVAEFRKQFLEKINADNQGNSSK